MSNFFPWLESGKLHISAIIHTGLLLRLLDLFVSRPESPEGLRPNAR